MAMEDCCHADLDTTQILSTLSHETVRVLSLRLNTISPAFATDWRALAGVIGFSPLIIDNIAADNIRGDKTRWVLELWERSDTGASVKKLLFALLSLDLQACINIIRKDKHIEDESFEETMEAYRSKSKQPDWEKFVFSSIKDETVDLWPTQAAEKKVTIETRDKTATVEEYELQKETSTSSSTYPEYRPAPAVKDTVFISYYKDDPGHHKKVLDLAEWLNSNGYTTYCRDQCQEDIETMGEQKWTEQHYSKAEYVLLVGSKGYIANCYNKSSHVSMDYHLLSTELVCQNNLNNKRVIVIVMEGTEHRKVVPQIFLPYPPITWQRQERDLLHRLQNVPKYVKPKVGPKKILTSIREKF